MVYLLSGHATHFHDYFTLGDKLLACCLEQTLGLSRNILNKQLLQVVGCNVVIPKLLRKWSHIGTSYNK